MHAAKFNAKVPPVSCPQVEYPWPTIHVNFAYSRNRTIYIVVVYTFSEWPEIVHITPPMTTETKNLWTEIFDRNKSPDLIVSDNGPQFTSTGFQDFCQQLTIKQFLSPPYHRQSNGQVQRFVDTFKRAVVKSKVEGTLVQTLQNLLFTYGTTPGDMLPEQKSPAEILM